MTIAYLGHKLSSATWTNRLLEEPASASWNAIFTEQLATSRTCQSPGLKEPPQVLPALRADSFCRMRSHYKIPIRVRVEESTILVLPRLPISVKRFHFR